MKNYFLEYVSANTIEYRPKVINEILDIFANAIVINKEFYEELFEFNSDVLYSDSGEEQYRNDLFAFCLAYLMKDVWFEDIEIVELDIEARSCTIIYDEALSEDLEEVAAKIGFNFTYTE